MVVALLHTIIDARTYVFFFPSAYTRINMYVPGGYNYF